MAQFFPAASAAVKMPDMPTYRGIMEERDAYRKQQNAMAQEQLKQQQNAMRQMIYRQNVDASGNINQQGIIRGLAQAGLGAEIPEQMKAYGQGVEAVAKGAAEQYKLGQSFLTSAHDIIYNAATPEDAIAASVQYAQQHPGHPELMQGVTRLASRIKNMTPEEFAAAKPGILSENLTAQQRLEQDTQTQDLGGSTRVLMRPKYGSAPFTVAPGSEAQKTMSPQQLYEAQRDISNPEVQYIKNADGSVQAVPKRLGGGGGIPGARGGGVTAGQYGAAIESAVMQLAPGVRVSGRGRTPERNAEVGGVVNSYHLSDNARDLQPARGQSLDQLAAALAPLKQQGFDVMIERRRNHVHVEPGPNMARGAAAAPAAGGIKMGQVVPGSGGGSIKTTQQEQTASYNINRVLQAAAEIQRVTKNNPSANAPSALEATVSSLPLISQGVNFTRSSDRQIVAAAQRDLLDGLLYLATGAAYNKEQLQGQMESYIPSYSDAPATVASKRERLAALIASAKTRAGRAWTPQMDAALNALVSGGGRSPAATSGGAPKRLKFNPATGGFD